METELIFIIFNELLGILPLTSLQVWILLGMFFLKQFHSVLGVCCGVCVLLPWGPRVWTHLSVWGGRALATVDVQL